MHPLESMLSPYKASGKTISWDHDAELAFRIIKEKLASITKLEFFLIEMQKQLVIDALERQWDRFYNR